MRTFIVLSYSIIFCCLIMALSFIFCGCSSNETETSDLKFKKIELVSQIEQLHKTEIEIKQRVLSAAKEELATRTRILNENKKHLFELEEFKNELDNLNQEKAILLGISSTEMYDYMIYKINKLNCDCDE